MKILANGQFCLLTKIRIQRDVYSLLYGNYSFVSFRTFNSEKPIEVAISSNNFAPYATLALILMHLL